MKNMKGIITTAFVAVLCMKGLSDDCIGFGTNMLSVAFEDTGLSLTNRSLILTDISRVFDVFETLGDIFPLSSGNFQAEMLYKSPEALPEKFRPRPVLDQTNGVRRMILPRRLTDTYTNALAFIDAHHTAVSNAYAWLDWINSGDVTNASYQEKCELVFSSVMPTLSPEAADNLAGSLFITHPHPPSVLDFATETLPSGEMAVVTWARIPYRENGEADASAFPMVLKDGKWRYYQRR